MLQVFRNWRKSILRPIHHGNVSCGMFSLGPAAEPTVARSSIFSVTSLATSTSLPRLLTSTIGSRSSPPRAHHRLRPNIPGYARPVQSRSNGFLTDTIRTEYPVGLLVRDHVAIHRRPLPPLSPRDQCGRGSWGRSPVPDDPSVEIGQI